METKQCFSNILQKLDIGKMAFHGMCFHTTNALHLIYSTCIKDDMYWAEKKNIKKK